MNKMIDYKTKDGQVLKGFSQVDLDDLNKTLKKVYLFLKINAVIIFAIILWLLWQAKKYKFFTYMFRC